MPIGDGEVFLGYIHGGDVRHEFMASLLYLNASPEGAMIGRVGSSSVGSLLDVARDILCTRFLDNASEPWLLMVDTDTVWDQGTLTLLGEAADPDERPVVTAVVPALAAGGEGIYPSVYTSTRDETGKHDHFTPVRDLPPDGLLQVDGCGAACLLIHRRVLAEMRDKTGENAWFRHLTTGDGRVIGEDFSFCLRLADMGVPVYAHCGVRCGHAKTVIMRLPG